MREKFYQLDELQRARALQDEAAKLHIPVPVLSYQYEIADADGNIEEKGIGKSNSYTRNALNYIAGPAGLASLASRSTGGSPAFEDGWVNLKFTNGSLNTLAYYDHGYEAEVDLGTSSSPESLDSYLKPTSGLTKGAFAISTVFNTTTRKLITMISQSFKNNTASNIDICESGVVKTYGGGTYYMLFIRDVFSAIPVAPGQTITWTYVTEVSYPEP